MTYTIRFLPEIERDLVVGYRWYQSKYTGLGDEFLRLFFALANEISLALCFHQKYIKNFAVA